MIRRGDDPELPGDGREQEGRLHQREGAADTEPRAAAEGEIGVLGDALREIILPALRPEDRRLVEIARVAVDHPLAYPDLHSLRNMIAADRTVLERLAADGPRRRVEAH